MKKKKLVWIVIALLAAGGLSAYLATRKGPPPVMKTDPLGGPEARVVLRLTKEGMDAAKATRNSDAKLKKVAGRMKKEELEVLKQRASLLHRMNPCVTFQIRYAGTATVLFQAGGDAA